MAVADIYATAGGAQKGPMRTCGVPGTHWPSVSAAPTL